MGSDDAESVFALPIARRLFNDIVSMVNEEHGADGRIRSMTVIRSDIPGEEVLDVEIVYSRIAHGRMNDAYRRKLVQRLQENKGSLSLVPMNILVHGSRPTDDTNEDDSEY
jgi:hypothetical protein